MRANTVPRLVLLGQDFINSLRMVSPRDRSKSRSKSTSTNGNDVNHRISEIEDLGESFLDTHQGDLRSEPGNVGKLKFADRQSGGANPDG